ncbi:O-antigen ligase family protein [Oleiharenicola lentus]|uniref:O-antigen ligase family protein n=1 Tax=Oleiharenicola lentus TaxID=2508720 RepID=UPI003F663454
MSEPVGFSRNFPPSLSAWLEWSVVLGLAAMCAWITLCLGGYLAQTLVVTSWMLAALALLGGLIFLTRPQPLNWAALLPVPFLIYALGSVVLLAPAKWLAWREWLLWFQMWIVFVLTLHFGRTRRQTWVMVATFVGLGMAGVGMAAYQRYADPKWIMLGRTQASQFFGRSAGMFGIPNSLAGLLELMVPACLTLMFSRTTTAVGKVLCGWLAALFVFAVVLTGSRGGWIGLGGALMLWPLLAGREWKRKLGGAVLILFLAAAGVWALYRFSEPARERIQPFIEGKFEASRPVMWRTAVKIWQDYPWLGSGAASYNVVFDQYRPKHFNTEPDWTHNDYLNTLSDYGGAGFVLWAGAGAWLLIQGWRAVQRARRETTPSADTFALAKWKLGLLLGLIAFALHLGVDFHTKIPALAFAAAVAMALVLRDEPALRSLSHINWRRAFGVLFVTAPLALVALIGSPLYRAEALRFAARREIDRYAAKGQGDPKVIIPRSLQNFEDATQIYPTHGQAWADLSYATAQSWHVTPNADLKALGQQAEAAADRAVALCAVNAEFWVRRGVALDMQARRTDAEACFKRAVMLAPNSPAWHYYYAYHLSVRTGRRDDALRAVETCLALDPSFSAGVALHQQLTSRR